MAAPFLGRGGEFPCRIDPPCIESVVPSDAVDASADEEQRDGEQRQNREDERQPRALRQRVEVKVEMLALTMRWRFSFMRSDFSESPAFGVYCRRALRYACKSRQYGLYMIQAKA